MILVQNPFPLLSSSSRELHLLDSLLWVGLGQSGPNCNVLLGPSLPIWIQSLSSQTVKAHKTMDHSPYQNSSSDITDFSRTSIFGPLCTTFFFLLRFTRPLKNERMRCLLRQTYGFWSLQLQNQLCHYYPFEVVIIYLNVTLFSFPFFFVKENGF
ncbi:hypothetical protein NMG60_11005786 [Bertholletia excelsa]